MIHLLSLFFLVNIVFPTSFVQKIQTNQYIPITIGTENIINFVVADKQNNQTLNTNQAYSFSFNSLPKWIDIVNGATLSGIPKSGANKISITYKNQRNSFTKEIYLSDSNSSFQSNKQPNSNLFGMVGYSKTANSSSFLKNDIKNINVPQTITVILPTTSGPNCSLSGNPVLVSLQAPPQYTSINFVTPNPNSYSQDSIQAIVTSQQTAQNNYLQTILALSKARQQLQTLNFSSENLNKNLLIASQFLNKTKQSYNKATQQQQISQQKISQANSSFNNLQNQIKNQQQKLNNINDLIATIQAQIVQANALSQSAQNNQTNIQMRIDSAQKQVNQAFGMIKQANENISKFTIKIRDAQNTIAIYSTNIYLAQSNLNSSNARFAAAEAQYLAAKQVLKQAQQNYDNLTVCYKQAPSIINNSQKSISELKATLTGKLTFDLDQSKSKLSDLKRNQANIKQQILLVNNATKTLQQQLLLAREAVTNTTNLIKTQQQFVQNYNTNYNQLLSNKATADSNVFTLKTQMGLAETNFDKAQSATNALKLQITNAFNSYKIAVDSFRVAEATKAVSDAEVQKILSKGLIPMGNLKGNF